MGDCQANVIGPRRALAGPGLARAAPAFEKGARCTSAHTCGTPDTSPPAAYDAPPAVICRRHRSRSTGRTLPRMRSPPALMAPANKKKPKPVFKTALPFTETRWYAASLTPRACHLMNTGQN